MEPFAFLVEATDCGGKARAGTLFTAHGPVPTPAFMPVGTVGTVKAVRSLELQKELQASILLANTYHLYLRPGPDILQEAGGLHRFMGWNGPLLTDSGGYQVYSLARTRSISEQGVLFQSHVDGSRHLFTPERVMDIQRAIGADIVMAFDECPPYPCSEDYARRSMELTHRWLIRCVERWQATEPLYGYPQALFPILQGSVYSALREASGRFVTQVPAPGYAIGGLAVGEPAETMYAMVELACDILPFEKPRYLMGVGTPVNILESVARGVDMFDCVIPTRNARHGMLFTWQGIIRIKNTRWQRCFEPLNPTLFGEEGYTLAYLHHLFRTGEILALHLATLHNLHFYLELMRAAREQILSGDFEAWRHRVTPALQSSL
ncbi:MAG: tRNA guanosine(34) transglycosylase Tgt [Flavobacteriales bacterium]|nr:tRNA guanosine(34) transglycosylase Tgt [Flavobacteriales bacterium]MCX7649127.1 tRNA guanosine(34) transglycosylase Tgt [Flavobacteriales bacterium]MDW8410536.1 tRNA guanosine(34) transglycosylase Tgt [Flavobacteriales bacterium]